VPDQLIDRVAEQVRGVLVGRRDGHIGVDGQDPLFGGLDDLAIANTTLFGFGQRVVAVGHIRHHGHPHLASAYGGWILECPNSVPPKM
jgi:hypothetical protein